MYFKLGSNSLAFRQFNPSSSIIRRQTEPLPRATITILIVVGVGVFIVLCSVLWFLYHKRNLNSPQNQGEKMKQDPEIQSPENVLDISRNPITVVDTSDPDPISQNDAEIGTDSTKEGEEKYLHKASKRLTTVTEELCDYDIIPYLSSRLSGIQWRSSTVLS